MKMQEARALMRLVMHISACCLFGFPTSTELDPSEGSFVDQCDEPVGERQAAARVWQEQEA